MNARLPWIVGLLMVSCSAWAGEAPWPTVHKDNQRAAFTEQVIGGPYERKWFRDFHEEMIATRVEAVLAEGKCFVGTFAGNLYALDVIDGRTVWQFRAGGPIGASACYHEGKIYFGCDDGQVYCLNAADGKLVWRYRADASVWVAPVCDGQTVYFGDRSGVFHAVAADTGRERWTYQTGGMILTPASITADGKTIVFASEDMHVYGLDANGSILWKSAKLGGLSVRDHAPTIWQGLAIVTTNPAVGFHHAAGQNPTLLTRAQKELPLEPEDKIIQDKWGQYTMKLTPRRLETERKAVLAFLKNNRHEQTFYAFDLKTGKEPWTAPVLYTAGLHNPPTPPAFNSKTGELYVWTPTALSNYSAGVPGGAIAVGKLDRQTGLVDILYHTNGDKLGWAFDFVAPADETQSLSLMGNILLNTHQGIIGGMRLDNLKWHRIYIARDTYGGIFGPATLQDSFAGADKAHVEGVLALMPNEWHGPDRSIVSIGYNRFFWVVGSQVVCLGGPDTPKTDTGGTKPPPPIRRKQRPVTPAGNVAAGIMGGFDESVPKPRITPEQLRKYLAPPRFSPRPLNDGQGEGVLASQVRRKLDAAVSELISKPWAPLIIELGISGEDRYFHRPLETVQILSLALPHLSPDVRKRAKAYLGEMALAPQPGQWPHEGTRREPYDLGPDMIKLAISPLPQREQIEDAYAMWAGMHYANIACGDLRLIFDHYIAQSIRFDHRDKDNDTAEHLNAEIAGVLACARVLANDPDGAGNAALSRLAELVSLRIHPELADTTFVRPTKTAAYKLHQAKIPRYLELTPEVAQMLHDFAGEALARNLAAISRDLPVWHHAFGERLIGGENYISPPTLSRGLFMALADGVQAPPEQLIARLDQPWCRADLYYIEKLTAILRRLDAK